MRLLNEHRLRTPEQTRSASKSCYFKLNVHPATGCLEAAALFADCYFEGERTTVTLRLRNVGTEAVTKVCIACDEEMFGFKSKELSASIEASAEQSFEFDIAIPLVGAAVASGEERRVSKVLLLYRTKERFRVSRAVNRFTVVRVAELEGVACERVSTRLHLLSFSMRRGGGGGAAVEWLAVPGCAIEKTEAAHLATQTNYFFFVRRDDAFPMATFAFGETASPIDTFPAPFIRFGSVPNRDCISFRLLWRKERRFGFIAKEGIAVTVNKQSYLSTKFPIGFRVSYTKQVTHNFRERAFVAVPISIKLRNVLCGGDLHLSVSFAEGAATDSSWEGVAEKRLLLRKGAEQCLEARFLAVRPGIYNLSDEIRYRISDGRSEPHAVTHSDHEQLFLIVRGDSPEPSPDLQNAFKKFADNKPQTKIISTESLI
jgi:hypothetical protein